jgi:hypothetical protein
MITTHKAENFKVWKEKRKDRPSYSDSNETSHQTDLGSSADKMSREN